jgi:hypothetical protein
MILTRTLKNIVNPNPDIIIGQTKQPEKVRVVTRERAVQVIPQIQLTECQENVQFVFGILKVLTISL